MHNTEELEVLRPPPKKQKIKATGLEQELKVKSKVKPIVKETLQRYLGILKEEAGKRAKYHMNIMTRYMEDTDEE